jgi:hypothetical protein
MNTVVKQVRLIDGSFGYSEYIIDSEGCMVLLNTFEAVEPEGKALQARFWGTAPKLSLR